jgi:hypothetical protein
MFRSYDHLQAEIYTFEINMTGIMVVGSWRTYKWLLLVSQYCVVVVLGVVFILCC